MSKPFERIAVVGTGTLGAQIALLASNAGYRVTIFDQRAGAFAEMINKLHTDLQTKGVDPFIPYDRWEKCKKQVQEFKNLEATIKDAELVIEAVPENLELKQKIEKGELGVKSGTGFYTYPNPEYLQDDFLSAGK